MSGLRIDILYTSFATAFPEGALHSCLATLPPAIGEKILRFHRWEDRQAGLLGKLLLREALGRYGYGADGLNALWTDSYGRPQVDGPVDFNISHSGAYVLCAVTSGGRVGVDVERVRELDVSGFQRYFSPKSWQEISRDASPGRRKFFDHWTMRECVIKADGRGLSVPLQELVIEKGEAVLDGTTWFLTSLGLFPGHCCHLATDRKNPEIRLSKLIFPDLLD